MTEELGDRWPQIRAQLRTAIGEPAYGIWIEPLSPLELSGRTLVLSAPRAIRGWVVDRYGRTIQTCAAAVLGPDVTVEVAGAPGERSASLAEPPRDDRPVPGRVELHPRYTFEQFVIGDSNRLAHASALAVAELPGQAYNPLFIYGPPGVGKTHLLHSIAHYVRAHSPELRVRYTTIEAFTSRFVTAIQSGATDEFKRLYRESDVLLIDDVQFLESKARTEEEFFHTFNALYETGAQLVVTSDRTPSDLAALEERLQRRFLAGLVADLQRPDPQTRRAILTKRIRHDEVELAEDGVLELIAERVPQSIRALEGALIRVVAYGSLTNRPVTLELAEEVLGRLYPKAAPTRCSIREVQEACCEAFGLSREELISPNRSSQLVWSRQIAIYLCRELTGDSLPAIGRAFGGRNHATILHAHRRAKELVGSDRAAADAVEQLRERLGRPDNDRVC